MYMYNNFSSKKTKKVISALLASALVVTSGPITADAATNKVVGVKKSFTVTASATNRVTGLSKAEKKVVKVTKKGKKFTIKGLKAGKATFKIGKKAYTVKVGATAVKAAKAKVTLTAGKSAAVKFTATAGNGDTVAFTTSNKKVATLSKTSAKVSKNAAYVRVTAKAAGTAKVTATSKVTGKKAVVTVTVKKATTPATATPEVTATVPVTTAAVTATPEATATAPVTTAAVTATPEVTPATTAAVTATPEATPVTTAAVTATPEVTPTTTAAVTATPEVTSTPEAVSATAITAVTTGASVVAVTFNQPVVGTNVKFAITKGTGASAITKSISKVEWIDNKTALLTLSEKIADDTYEVTATENGGKALTNSFKGEVEKAAQISVDSVRVEKSATATINISLKNQFKEAMDTSGVTATVYNVTQSQSVKVEATTNGKITINTNSANLDDVIRITLAYGTLNDSKTVTVVKDKVANSVEFGTLTLGDKNEDRLIEKGTFKLPITIKDQYGEAFKLSTAWTATETATGDVCSATAGKVVLANGTVIESSNTGVLDLTKVTFTDGVPTFTAGTGTNDGSKATITVTVAATGEIKTFDVTVYAERQATKLVGFAANSKLAAEKTLEEGKNIEVALTDFAFIDQYGKAIVPTKVEDTCTFTVNDTVAKGTDGTTSDQGAVVLVSAENAPNDAPSTFTDTTTGMNVFDGNKKTYIYGMNGATEKVTFKYTAADGKTVTTLESNIKVIPAVKSVVATADKTAYNAGDTATITFKAYTVDSNATDANINKDYSGEEYVSVTVGAKKYTRAVAFKAGVAKITVPVTESGDKISINCGEVAGKTTVAITVKVNVGTFEKYNVEYNKTSKNITMTAQDAYGNKVETKKATSLITKVTAQEKIAVMDISNTITGYKYQNVTLKGTGIDSEGTILATETSGVVTISNAIAENDFTSGKTYVITIVLDGVNYTVEYTAA